MKKNFFILSLGIFSMLLNAQQLTYISRAIGNSDHMGKGPHMQNFIEDMVVTGDGTCTTYSVWDEGGHPEAAYKDGVYIGKATYKANSKTVKDKSGKTWTIQNYYGRFLNSPLNSFPNWRVDPVPTGNNAPYISCSDGRTITGIADPSALGINLKTGELLVADNGIDQNIKVFDISSTPLQVRTFGKQGGVFNDPIPGSSSDILRFRGVSGVGGDNNGNIYVSLDGFPGAQGSGGGAEIRAFNPDGTLRWRMYGFIFLGSGSVDPASLDGTDIYGAYHHFKLDYSKPQGSDWAQTAMTINPFLFPDDQRLVSGTADCYAIKHINGKKYMFLTDMFCNTLSVYRCDGEIAVPCAVFCVQFGWNGDEITRFSWNFTRGRPIIKENNQRWLWVDKNGDTSGMYQPEEYSMYNTTDVRITSFEIDNVGNVYLASGDNGNIYKFPTNGFDSYGNPKYTAASRTIFANVGHGAYSMEWVQENDMFVCGDGDDVRKVDIWQNWSSASRSKVRSVTMPGHRTGPARQVTADKDYFYIDYLETGGPKTGKQGEIDVYKMSDGSFLGYIIPGPEVGSVSGQNDMTTPLHIFITSNGKRIITNEEDEVGKVLVYEWTPNTSNVPVTGVTILPASLSIAVNSTSQLMTTVAPESATNKSVSWSSSNTSIATVSTSGLVLGKSTGNTTITATTSDGSKTATCAVTVTTATAIIKETGTAYRWYGNAISTSNSNSIEAPALNDGNLTTDVSLAGGSEEAFENAYEAAGLIFSSAKTITKVEFVNGTFAVIANGVMDDGCFDEDFKFQTSVDGTTWTDVSGWTVSPVYDYWSTSVSGATFTFTGNVGTAILGVRITGKVRTSESTGSWEARVREITAYSVQITGIHTTQKESDIFLYSNPDNSNLTLANVQPNSVIKVVSMSGSIISEVLAKSETVKFDVSNWGKGVYLFYVKTGSNEVIKKAVIQ